MGETHGGSLGKKDREYAVGSWLAADKFVVMSE